MDCNELSLIASQGGITDELSKLAENELGFWQRDNKWAMHTYVHRYTGLYASVLKGQGAPRHFILGHCRALYEEVVNFYYYTS